MNLGEIRDNVVGTLRERAVPTGWSLDELNRYINDVYSDTAKQTRSLIQTLSVPVSASNQFMPLPRGTVQVLSLYDEATGKPIDHVDWYWIDQRNRVFARKTSNRPRYAAYFGMSKLLLYPAYGSAGTVNATVVLGKPLVDLENDSDVPLLPVEYHRSLVFGATHRAMVKDAKKKRMKMALKEYQRWQGSLGQLSRWAQRRHEKIAVGNWGNNLRNARSGRGW